MLFGIAMGLASCILFALAEYFPPSASHPVKTPLVLVQAAVIQSCASSLLPVLAASEDVFTSPSRNARLLFISPLKRYFPCYLLPCFSSLPTLLNNIILNTDPGGQLLNLCASSTSTTHEYQSLACFYQDENRQLGLTQEYKFLIRAGEIFQGIKAFV